MEKQRVIMMPEWQYDKMMATYDKMLEDNLRLKKRIHDLEKAEK